MGGSERTWGSKGRASWKVTLSSRRWVLYRFGLPHPVLPLLSLVHHSQSRSHLFFLRATRSVFAFAEALAISSIPTCAQPVHLSSPPFFSHANSNFEGNACIFPNLALSPGLPPLRRPLWAFLSSIPPVIPFFRALSPTPLIPSRIIPSPSFGIHSPPPRSPVPQPSAPGDPPTT
jgi:hypothetical protein